MVAQLPTPTAPWVSDQGDGTFKNPVLFADYSDPDVIRVGKGALISQRAFLCGGTHDFDDPAFPLVTKPIDIGEKAWIAAEAMVLPGVTVHDGAVLGARACAHRDLEPWTVYAGNPCKAVRRRKRH